MIRGLFGMVLLLLFMITTFLVGQTLYESDLEQGKVRDIYNFTSELEWKFDPEYKVELYNQSIKDIVPINNVRLSNIIYKFTDFIGYTGFQVAKWGVEFGYTNPQYDFWLIFDLIKLWLIALIIMCIIPIIIPTIALITILCMLINKLIKRRKLVKKE